MNLYKKNLLFRSHPRSPVYATAVSLVLIGRMRTTCRPKPCPSPPPPYLSPTPVRDNKRTGVGRGGAAAGHLLPPVLRPHSLTALTLHICQMPPVISDGPPFYRENAPVGALKPEMTPLGGGVGGGKKHVWLETPPLWEKIHRAVTLDPAHISSLDGCIP